ncbi:MAG: Ferredoxin--NADP reductase [Candidatus Woesearchaeota archaeon]|nr:Ferredoxin--NADP reductase [Candidatus Woesearchaeota archaeon]
MYDVIIIGGGPAGLTAAIYTCRKQLKTLVISMNYGGQTMMASHMENYPGYEGSGLKLMEHFQKQAKDFGAKLIDGKVVTVDDNNGVFTVKLSEGDVFKGKSVILAFGKVPRSIGISGEDKFLGKGVHVCATCDAPMYQDKEVLVVGGGNSALHAVQLLSGIASKVYLMHRRDEFRGDELLVKKIKKKKNVEFLLSHLPKEIKGDTFVNSIVVLDRKTQKTKEIKVEGVFLEIGYEVKADLVKHLVDLNDKMEVKINSVGETSHRGVFAAGDVTTTRYKQTVIAAGEGAKAGLSAYSYVKQTEVDTDIS